MARLAAAICPPAAKLRLKHGIGRSELAIPSDSVLRSNCTELHRTAPNCTELHRTAPNCTELHRTAPNCTVNESMWGSHVSESKKSLETVETLAHGQTCSSHRCTSDGKNCSLQHTFFMKFMVQNGVNFFMAQRCEPLLCASWSS